MFTGIIEELGLVQKIGGGKLTIKAHEVLTDVHIGDSIAVNGVCLTVTQFTAASFTSDVMPETIRRTSYANLSVGVPVNLERALLVGHRFGGHIVSGHIDGRGIIEEIKDEGNAILVRIAAEPKILRGIVEKGSVALDGISLTVVSVSDRDFTVSIIPHSRRVTNLSVKKVGDFLNIENDIVGKYVERMLSLPPETREAEPVRRYAEASKLTRNFLMEYGF